MWFLYVVSPMGRRLCSSSYRSVSVHLQHTVRSLSLVFQCNIPQRFLLDNLILDTGSSNTWVGANKPYTSTSSSVDTHDYVVRPGLYLTVYAQFIYPLSLQEVDYGSGFFFGEEYDDTVTIESLVIKNQGVGGSFFSEGFDTVDGILGSVSRHYPAFHNLSFSVLDLSI